MVTGGTSQRIRCTKNGSVFRHQMPENRPRNHSIGSRGTQLAEDDSASTEEQRTDHQGEQGDYHDSVT